MSPAARVLLFAVRVYQAFFSALMPSACKFYPSCSHYAADALRIHGARRGTWLALRRLARCHPFSRGGVDLVPSRTGFFTLNNEGQPAGVPSPTTVKPDRLPFMLQGKEACPTEKAHS